MLHFKANLFYLIHFFRLILVWMIVELHIWDPLMLRMSTLEANGADPIMVGQVHNAKTSIPQVAYSV